MQTIAMRAGYEHHPGEEPHGEFDVVLPHPETGWELHMVFTDDGAYVPALARLPEAGGPVPTVICLHPGSGGLGVQYLADQVLHQATLLDRLLDAGFGVVVAEGRCENEGAYGTADAPVLDHEDVCSVFRHVRDLPEVDADRVAFFGVSHGGELQLKAVAKMGGGPAALVPAEPAVIELLGLRYPGARVEAELQYNRPVGDDEIDLDAALARIERIPTDLPILLVGRDDDHLQGVFRKAHELLERTGHAVEWATFDHPDHAYQFGPRDDDAPDAVTAATQDAVVSFLVRVLRR